MFSPRSKRVRPLGQYYPESRLELQVEKAMFRRNSQLLRDMCTQPVNRKEQEMMMPPNTPLPVGNNITPEVRWLLTRSARMRRMNDAGYSKYRKPVKDRVVSANGRKNTTLLSFERQRTMCDRSVSPDAARMRKLHCDVLGPSFCTDCTELKKKNKILLDQRRHFPRIEVHPRALVAPEKVERLYMSHPQQLFSEAAKKTYQCGCDVNPALEITTPLVYTPNEVFQRIRKQHRERAEMKVSQQNVAPSLPDEPKPTFYDEKTDPPMNLKVSVTFRQPHVT